MARPGNPTLAPDRSAGFPAASETAIEEPLRLFPVTASVGTFCAFATVAAKTSMFEPEPLW
jgi:hypothetical protein